MLTYRRVPLLLLLLGLLLVACQDQGRQSAAVATEAPPSGHRVGSTPVAGSFGKPANAASTGCENPVPDDRRFPLPPWPRTNFCLHSVPYEEIFFGGVHRDRIKSIDRPVFQTVEEASGWLTGVEPVVVFEVAGDARAYPLQVLVWHEIVNDIIAEVPVTITYCPLCNAALVFDRRVDGRRLDFGVSGNLRQADLIMYDRQTESWWQQLTGEAIVGDLTGVRLTLLPSRIVSFADFRASFPGGQVLFPDVAGDPYERSYGETPYVNYDSLVNPRTKYLDGEADPRLPPKMRVLALDIDGKAVAYPYGLLEEQEVIHDTVAGQPLVVFWRSGTVSPLYGRVIADSKDVGSTAAFSRLVNGQALTFRPSGQGFQDEQTGSRWDFFGVATGGPLAGARLEPVAGHEFLWFAWAAFRPDTRLYGQAD